MPDIVFALPIDKTHRAVYHALTAKRGEHVNRKEAINMLTHLRRESMARGIPLAIWIIKKFATEKG